METKILYVYGGAPYHSTPTHNAVFAAMLADYDRFDADFTTNLDALTSLPGGK